MDLDTLLNTYLSPPTNFLGSAIFLLYIIAALALTWTTVFDLQDKHVESGSSKKSLLARRVLFAYVSFGVLAYHMSFYLVRSYISWSHRSKLPLPTSADDWKLYVGSWMFQSTLFTDFAQELVSSPWAVVWTTSAVLWTGAVNLWMALEGRRNHIKGLWKYFALAQILPVSFAQSLFAIDLLLTQHGATPKRNGALKDKPNTPVPRPLLDGGDFGLILITTLAAVYLTSILPTYSDKPEFIGLVLAVRLLLFVPYIIALRQQMVPDPDIPTVDATWFLTVLLVPVAILLGAVSRAVPSSMQSYSSALTGLDSGMAVKALGYDLILGVSGAVLMTVGVL